MAIALLILAESDNSAKLIFGAIAAAIWLISAIAGQFNKKKEEERRRRVREEIERIEQVERLKQMGGPAPPAPSPQRMPDRLPSRLPERPAARLPDHPPMRAPERLPDRPAARLPDRFPPYQPERARPMPAPNRPASVDRPPSLPSRNAKKKKKVIQPAAEPQQIVNVSAAVEASPYAITRASDQTASGQRTKQSLRAGALALWLRPETLRQQFILTELFQPPISMRDSHLGERKPL